LQDLNVSGEFCYHTPTVGTPTFGLLDLGERVEEEPWEVTAPPGMRHTGTDPISGGEGEDPARDVPLLSARVAGAEDAPVEQLLWTDMFSDALLGETSARPEYNIAEQERLRLEVPESVRDLFEWHSRDAASFLSVRIVGGRDLSG